MKQKATLFTLVVLALVTCGLLSPVHASAGVVVPVTGSFTDAAGGAGQFIGTFSPQSFGVQKGQLVAFGTLVGNMTDSTGAALGTITSAGTVIPVSVAGATCPILKLDLGPLHLNLLGLVVNLNAIHLNITAVSGPGNLLGNLLCAVAHLLDGGAPDLGVLSTLLNRILLVL
jgi:hypothetical protein